MPEPDIRGWAARNMVAQDSRWAVDVILSGRQTPPLESLVPLLVGHHVVRIAYEGTLTLQAEDPSVGIPELAELLNHDFAAITARVRHATKLLDDTKKTFDDVVEQFEDITRDHQAEFLGNTHRLLRWFETDLGTFHLDGTFVGATVPIAYRLGIDGVPDGDQLRTIAEEWGGALAVLTAAAFDGDAQQPTLDLTAVSRIRHRDVRSDRFLSSRYEPGFPAGLKMLLLAVESEVNTLRTFIPATEAGHEDAVFRLKTVTTYHALSALQHLRERYVEQTAGMRSLGDLLTSEPAAWLLSRQGKAIRNRSMHYPILENLALDPDRPMFGIVQAISGRPHEEVAADVDSVLSRVSDHFSEWSRR